MGKSPAITDGAAISQPKYRAVARQQSDITVDAE
jgi:hypothetical protein